MWSTPKTNWYGAKVDGVYSGDKFNAADFNRIKNNLDHLRNLAIKMYDEFNITSLGSDRTPKDYFYADEINTLEENFAKINANTLKRSYGNAPKYVDHGKTPDYKELNRLEGAMLDLYDKMTNQRDGQRNLTFNFGTKGGL